MATMTTEAVAHNLDYEHSTFLRGFMSGLEPDPILTVSQWADEHRVLSQKSSSEPGYWRTSRTPFLKEIMDCLSATSPVREITFMKGAQIGGTEAGLNWLGYLIDHAPGPILAVSPTVELAKRSSKQRLAPLIEECPRLREKVKDSKSRDSGNTILMKEFPGGLLVLTGANSAVGLRSLPARYLFLDELDAYPQDVDGEGDPVALAKKRSNAFASRRKIFYCSTPLIAGRSRIEEKYEDSDKRKYFVPCPECNEFQWLHWAQVKWPDGQPLDAWYECEHCQCKIENWQKTKMLAGGEWRAEKPGHKKGRVVGFHLSSLYSPVGWVDWGELADEFVHAKDNIEALKTFVNTVLGETWKDKGDAPDWKRLHDNRLDYKTNIIPPEVCLITAGADIQKDRIEVEIVGWQRNKISWSIDYRVFMGNTDNPDSEPWRELAELSHEIWQTPTEQEIHLSMLAVDSGYNTSTVYAWCRRFSMTRVVAIKGSDSQTIAVGQPKAIDVNIKRRRMRGASKVFTIGVGLLKHELYGWLRLPTPDEGKPPPYGFCHFPQYNEEYFKQLTAEELQVKLVRGYKHYEWIKKRPRNEALDCRLYARAAASIKGIDRFKESHWQKLENDLGIVYKEANESNLPKPRKKITIKRRKSTFLE